MKYDTRPGELTVRQEWVPALRHADIVAVKPIAGEVPGLADKWLVVLEGNYQAMVKRVQTWAPVRREWQQPGPAAALPLQYRPKRADRGTQGYNEVVGYYLDRVLGMYRVPPIVGRLLSSKLLFSYALDQGQTRLSSFCSLFLSLNLSLPHTP